MALRDKCKDKYVQPGTVNENTWVAYFQNLHEEQREENTNTDNIPLKTPMTTTIINNQQSNELHKYGTYEFTS